MKHVLGHQPSVIRQPGPLTRLTPACSCGWRGVQVKNVDDCKTQRDVHQADAVPTGMSALDLQLMAAGPNLDGRPGAEVTP